MNSKLRIREQSHAGSWYSNEKITLEKELNQWLKQTICESTIEGQKIKAIIGPHAGLFYSGPTSAWVYQYLKAKKDLKVFLLGPCHYVSIKGCGITSMDQFETPLGNILVDQKICGEIRKSNLFEIMNKEAEEEEHSLEMHLPYIQTMLKTETYSLVPIMVGQLNSKLTEQYAQYLVNYFDDDNTIFITSSDFCHWGKRFQYQYYDEKDGQIFQSIEKLDKLGMNLIEQHDTKGFENYMKQTQNTICGRYPIQLLLKVKFIF